MNLDNFDYNLAEAYALGYFDGRSKGVDTNPYEYDDTCRFLYTQGYERGVADYCELDTEDE